MSRRPRVGVLGGTFDPIHLGHLAAAQAAADVLDLDVVKFVPSARPPHRPESPRASEYHRVEMIRRAISERAGWELSDLELRRHGPSYTWDTLVSLHESGLTPSQIFFITGADAFAEIASWHRYPEVLDAAHFVVITRPGFSIEAVRRRLPALTGRIATADDGAKSATPRVILIEANTPDISSTEIRARAGRGASLDRCVPPAVAAYIRQHHLYDTAAAVSAPPDASDAPAPPEAPSARKRP